MNFHLPFSLIVPAFLLSFAIPALFTACKPARKVPVVYTISGDISHQNMFPVKDTVNINDDTTVKTFLDRINSYGKKPGCGIYLQKEEDNTRIKFVFPLIGIYEDIPEHNETYWQQCFIGGKSTSTPSDNDPKQRPTDTGIPSIENNPEYVGSSIAHNKRYVLVPLALKNGNLYLDGEKTNIQTLKEMLSGYKICIYIHFENKNDCVARYWQDLKQAVMMAQGRLGLSAGTSH